LSDDDQLYMWVIYDHPSDLPDWYVARPWIVVGKRAAAIRSDIRSKDLDEIRHFMVSMGLTCLDRSPRDNPVIIEVWLGNSPEPLGPVPYAATMAAAKNQLQ
jgi:hypothetical protein